MPKVKISEYSATANSNTDVASINIDEGCAPSGINNAIRAIMGHLKDFQSGTNGDPFNGPVNGTVGATTPSTGAFTTLSATGNVTLGDASTDTLNVGNGGLIKDASGNLGLGVTPSAWAATNPIKAIQVGRGGSISYGNDSASTNVVAGAYLSATGQWTKIGTVASAKLALSDYDGSFVWSRAASGSGNFTYTDVMTLDASGNLGLGVTPSWDSSTSASAIQFRSNAGSVSGSSGYMNIGQNWYQASSANRYLVSSLPATLYEQNNGTHKWYNAPSGTAGNAITFTQAMTLDASGNLLVGLTSALGSQLGVQAAGGNGTSFTLRHTSATAGKYRLAGIDSSNNYLVYNNSNVGMYMTDGGTSWTATSDETQKILTSEFSNAAIFISTVRATRGRYKTDDESTSRSFLIAQDWQDYLPEAISEKDGILGLSYQDTIPVLVKAIQELTARITALEGA